LPPSSSLGDQHDPVGHAANGLGGFGTVMLVVQGIQPRDLDAVDLRHVRVQQHELLDGPDQKSLKLRHAAREAANTSIDRLL
jgi:hypothetical protein